MNVNKISIDFDSCMPEIWVQVVRKNDSLHIRLSHEENSGNFILSEGEKEVTKMNRGRMPTIEEMQVPNIQ